MREMEVGWWRGAPPYMFLKGGTMKKSHITVPMHYKKIVNKNFRK